MEKRVHGRVAAHTTAEDTGEKIATVWRIVG
jgi:hypothetical protein